MNRFQMSLNGKNLNVIYELGGDEVKIKSATDEDGDIAPLLEFTVFESVKEKIKAQAKEHYSFKLAGEGQE